MRKRILSVFLALYMALTLVPTALASDEPGILVPGSGGDLYSSQTYTGTTTWSAWSGDVTVYLYPVGTVFTPNPLVGSYGGVWNVTNVDDIKDGTRLDYSGTDAFTLTDSSEVYFFNLWNGLVFIKGDGPAPAQTTAPAASEYAAVYPGSGYYITAKRYGNQELAKSIWGHDRYFSDGLIQCGSNGGYGYLDKDGNVVISGESLDAIGCAKGSGEHFSEGLCAFRSTSGGYGYMDKTGRVVLQPEYSADHSGFHEGLAVVKNRKRDYGNTLRYIDQDGNTVLDAGVGIPNLYAHSNFDGGRAVSISTEIIDGKAYDYYNIIDRSGRTLATYSPRKSDGSPSFLYSRCYFSEGYGVAYNSNWELHVFDTSGNLVWWLENPNGGSNSYSAQLDNDDLSGVHGGILIYSTASTGENCKAVEIPSGRSVFPEGVFYSAIYDNFSDGVVTFQDGKRGYGLVDSDGFEVVSPEEFSSITPFNEGLALAKRTEGQETVCYLLEKHDGSWSGSLPQGAAQPVAPAAPDTPETPAASGLENFRRTETYTPGQFSDVPAGDWYASSVQTAYELGLVKGSGPDAYAPANPISVAETLALACRLHNTYYGGSADFSQGSPWYQVYVDYAVASGIIPAGGISDYTADADRQTFAAIMANALPAEALPAVNSVGAGDIPDSGSISPDSLPAVLRLYNAGILTGSDDKGTFYPHSSIQRSEVAAVVARMAVPAERVSIAS